MEAKMRRAFLFPMAVLFIAVPLFSQTGQDSPKAHPLHEVKTVKIEATVVPNPSKVKEPYAADILQGYLRAALERTGVEAGDSLVKVHLVLNEYTTVDPCTLDGRLVITESGKELADVPITLHNSEEPAKSKDQMQLASRFRDRLVEEINKLK
jgi:hypothetical protein